MKFDIGFEEANVTVFSNPVIVLLCHLNSLKKKNPAKIGQSVICQKTVLISVWTKKDQAGEKDVAQKHEVPSTRL